MPDHPDTGPRHTHAGTPQAITPTPVTTPTPPVTTPTPPVTTPTPPVTTPTPPVTTPTPPITTPTPPAITPTPSPAVCTRIDEGFDGFETGTRPAGWTFTNCNLDSDTYTAAGSYGRLSPSIKLDATGDAIETAAFSGGEWLQFWVRGQGTDVSSTLLVEEYYLGGSWTAVTDVSSLPASGTTLGTFGLLPGTTRVRFTYTKSAGEVAFDDVLIKCLITPTPGPATPTPTPQGITPTVTTPTPPFTTPTPPVTTPTPPVTTPTPPSTTPTPPVTTPTPPAITPTPSPAVCTRIDEGFDGFETGTRPAGWTFTNCNLDSDTYTAAGSYGRLSPSIKLDATGDAIETAAFSGGEWLQFWVRGQGTDVSSSLLVEEYYLGGSWTAVTDVSSLPASGTTLGTFGLLPGTTRVRFTYTKSAGEVAFDDVLIKCLITPTPGPATPTPEVTTPTPPVTTPTPTGYHPTPPVATPTPPVTTPTPPSTTPTPPVTTPTPPAITPTPSPAVCTRIDEGFDGFETGTRPAGWTFTNCNLNSDTYTAAGSYGRLSPSIKLDATGDAIETAAFSGGEWLQFWVRGQGTDVSSTLLVEEYYLGGSWTAVTDVSSLPASGTTLGTFGLLPGTTRVRFTYTKSAGDVAFDDVLIKCLITPTPGPATPTPEVTTPTPPVTTPTPPVTTPTPPATTPTPPVTTPTPPVTTPTPPVTTPTPPAITPTPSPAVCTRIDEGFDGFETGTRPAGWTFTNCNLNSDTYTAAGSYGRLSPSIKLDATGDAIETAAFSGGEWLQFWVRGQGTDVSSTLLVEEYYLGGSWTAVTDVSSLPASGTTLGTFGLLPGTTQVRFTYTKSAGDVAFDDVLIKCLITPTPGPATPTPTTTPTPPVTTPTPPVTTPTPPATTPTPPVTTPTPPVTTPTPPVTTPTLPAITPTPSPAVCTRIDEGFDGFETGTRPAGWTFTNCNLDSDTYTAAGSYGRLSPSIKLDATGDAIETAAFSGGEWLQFWVRGQGTDVSSTLLVEEYYLGGSWTAVTDVSSLPASGTTLGTFGLLPGTTRVRFTYTKSAGEVAFDDVLIKCLITPTPGPATPTPTTTPTPPVTTPTPPVTTPTPPATTPTPPVTTPTPPVTTPTPPVTTPTPPAITPTPSPAVCTRIDEGFDGFETGTRPAGWTFTNCNLDSDTYTAAGSYGRLSPSIKLDATGDAIETAAFSGGEWLQFWVRGQGTDVSSSLLVEEYYLGGSWTAVTDVSSLPASGTTLGTFGLLPGTTQVRFTYTKSAGEVAFDDVLIKCLITPTPGPATPTPTTTPTPPVTTPTPPVTTPTPPATTPTPPVTTPTPPVTTPTPPVTTPTPPAITPTPSPAVCTRIDEGFDGFEAGTRPAGWTFTNCNLDSDTYTAAGSYGRLSPSIKLDATGDAIETAAFSGGEWLQFWVRGQGTDVSSSLLVEEYYLGGSWTAVTDVSSLPASGTTLGTFGLLPGTTRVRFTYTKSAGDVAFDDVLIKCLITPTPGPASPTPTSTPAATPTPPLTTPTPAMTPPPVKTPTPAKTPVTPPTPQTNTPTPATTPTPIITPTPQAITPTPVITPQETATPIKTPTPNISRTPSPTPSCGPTVAQLRFILQSGDYDGDGTSDIGIYRQSAGLWAVRGVTRTYFGGPIDLPVSGDYTGDGTSNLGIFRPTAGLWALRGVSRIYYGLPGDYPAPADYDGNGIADVCIFRPSAGLWSARGVTRTYFGAAGDKPVPGDYKGSGTDAIGIFRPSSGTWAIRGVTRIYFGGFDDWPLPGDYNGDGAFEAAIFRPWSTGLWAVRGVTRFYFGRCTDYPVRADFNGNGTDNPGVFRQHLGLWAARGVTRAYFGGSGDIPVAR